jgi:hypothetical protein
MELVNVSVKINSQKATIYKTPMGLFFGVNDREPFSFVVKNSTNRRLCVVASVDQRCVLKDKAAEFTDPGMILEPYGFYEFTGFRLNNSEVAEFVSTFESSETVANMATGKVLSCGVIGLAVFEEQKFEQPVYRSATRSMSPPKSGFAGTMAGDSIEDKVSVGSFQRRQPTPNEVISLFYKPMDWMNKVVELFDFDNPTPFVEPQTGYNKYQRH